MWRGFRVILLFGVVVVAAAVAGRGYLLRAAGRALMVTEPLRKADAIIVAIDAGGAGVLEAADLVREGIASRVVLFADPPSALDQEFVRRGVWYESEATRETRQLHALGVARVERIPQGVVGTENEGLVLPMWCDQQALTTVVIVSNADHTRRLRRVLQRAMRGHRTSVIVRSSRYSDFDPARWWQTRGGMRTEIVEFQKLLLDVVLHPIP